MSLKPRTHAVKQCYRVVNSRVTGPNLTASTSYEPNGQTEFTPFPHLYHLELIEFTARFFSVEKVSLLIFPDPNPYSILDLYCIA